MNAPEQNIDVLSSLAQEHFLFHEMDEQQLTQLVLMADGPIDVAAGDYIIQENEEPKDIYVIQSGLFEVLKQDEDKPDVVHKLAELRPGNTAGEVSLLDRGPRSASVRAVEASQVLVLSIDQLLDLENSKTENRSLSTQLKINLANEIGSRVRSANATTIDNLRQKLAEAKLRAEVATYVVRFIISLCIYMFSLGAALTVAEQLPNTFLITLGVLVLFSITVYINLKRSSIPLSTWGFTLENWRDSAREAVLFSLGAMAVIVGCKYLLVTFVPAWQGEPVFDFYQSRNLAPEFVIISAMAYMLMTPVQETAIRVGVQRPLQLFLTSKYSGFYAIFVSSCVFAALHLHISLSVAAFVFPMGLFWAWLYHRIPSLIGPFVSHMLVGVFSVFVVGFGF